ncbi:molybdate transport system substrate-binding protein [Solimonas aquatica]|uniref:Molybdate transport system substrate-binding protein n=1 Tax=Solimonas aquatica TaxID=489703 RepID=A0A1H9H9Z2_9GAMM|nr:molybdate ABC transporter substrate-binding protein [Solimonas aquatica]SEQ59037.1 molybdate transport system substrate-binding protein [Solimonas aquatica]
MGNSVFLRRLATALSLALVLALPSLTARAEDKPVVVFAAASLKEALDEVGAQWQKEQHGQVAISYAASNTLARQIEQGAPADLFLSANLEWLQYLSVRNLTRKDSERNLLRNRLVLIAQKASRLKLLIAPDFPLAKALGDGRLALCNPAVPAGIYGKQALSALNVWDSVSARTAQADNVRAALLLVSRGEAPLGIVYSTDAAADPAVRVLDTFPEDTHEPIVYPLALTAASTHPQARSLYDYIVSAKARAIFVKHGFTVITDAAH